MLVLFRSIFVARLLVGCVLLGLLSGAAGTVAEAATEHPRQVWKRALIDGTVERAVDLARAANHDAYGFDAQVAAFLQALQDAPGGDQLVAYLASVTDPGDVLRALLGTSQMGASVPMGGPETWLAPAPPTTTTLGARALLATDTQRAYGATPPRVRVATLSEEVGPRPLRVRFPALQPLGP